MDDADDPREKLKDCRRSSYCHRRSNSTIR
jgi:hypothetical protein